MKNILANRFLRNSDYHLAYHTNTKKYLLAHGVIESRITAIHNAIDEREIDLLSLNKARQMAATELRLPLDRLIFPYVGVMGPYSIKLSHYSSTP